MSKISRRGAIPPFFVMEVMKAANARAAAGGDVIHLEVGQPSTPAPAPVRKAAEAALRSERLGYTEALGLPVLREAISGHYRRRFGVAVPPERIVVTTGSSGAFLLAFLAAFDPGQRVAIAEPGYPGYRHILSLLGLEAVVLPARHDAGFRVSAELAGAAGPLDGLLVASPANPTGTVLAPESLRALVDFAAARDMLLILDEIYHGITYGAAAETVLKFSDRAIAINSFSKYFSMTGWRLGWMVVPAELLRPVECLAQNLFISAPTLSQWAALAAFEAYDELDGNVARYAENRGILSQGLETAGFDAFAPADGAFYLYADISRFAADSQDFCRRMLAETGVAATPGIDFDAREGQNFVRFSYAGLTADMIEAVKRLKDWRK